MKGMRIALASALSCLCAALAACAEPYPATLYLAPQDAELAALALAADARWEAAGVAPERVVVVPAGMPGAVPLRWLPDAAAMRRACRLPASYPHAPGGCVVPDSDGAPARVWLTPVAGQGCIDHETGHLLGVAEHLEAPGALMREDSGDWLITAADLEAVCAAGECAGWTPEGAL